MIDRQTLKRSAILRLSNTRGSTAGLFHDSRDVDRSFHASSCHHHTGRDREWTNCCRRDVRFAQVASHARAVSFHNGADSRQAVFGPGQRAFGSGPHDIRLTPKADITGRH